MPDFLPCYGDTEGPLGFPMREADARALEELLRQHPGHEYARATVAKATTELSPGERADVSWIQTECLDGHKDIVLTSGFDDTFYRANPIVTLNHDYTRQPVGRSLWRRKVRDGQTRGIKAKTVYPPRPDDWKEPAWAPDTAWGLVKAGLLLGKSIGFITLKARPPSEEEVQKYPEWANAWRVVEKWALVEYCCTWLPVNPECVVAAVAKSLIRPDEVKALGIDLPAPPPPAVIPFTTENDLRTAVLRRVAGIDPDQLAQCALQETIERLKGRV
jgi:hypothetical protein